MGPLSNRFGLRSLVALLAFAAIQLTCVSGGAVLDTYGHEMQENEQYYVCAAWLRESTNQWEFYGIKNQIEFPGDGYPIFSNPKDNVYRLWFCNTWDYTHENGWECMDRAGTLWENKEYSVGYRHYSGFAENWLTKKGERKVQWSKHRGTGFTLHSLELGSLVSRGGVVVVTTNYRLGLFGWFENINSWARSVIPGNQAFRDQILAFQWVQANIPSFGGDPTRVTVFGQSAGAHSIRALLSIPSAFGLYQRVISESDPLDIPFKTPQDATRINSYLLTLLGCNTGNLDCARAASVNDILEATLKADQLALDDDTWTTFGLVERPINDGELIVDDFATLVREGRYNTNASIMWGTVKDEAGYYVPLHYTEPVPIPKAIESLEVMFEKNRTLDILASPYFPLSPSDPDTFRVTFTQFGMDYYWLCPLQYFSRQMAKYKPTYNFRFSRGRDMPLVEESFCAASTGRVCHSNEIQTVFASGAAVPGFTQMGDDARFARQVVDRFTTFAKTGNPNPRTGGLFGVEITNPDVVGVDWLPYGELNATLDMNVESGMVYNLQSASCQWIE
ncbi:alpha/beta-hydrolase [Linnemannia elongata AG-77]|uniref:Carboxylic ester hydrolase n=1 Tax=Linnemannia elongata AG-77 TaxID=1314771 RepID=A0A197JTY8_9FUNG|nr:alpha/beta-hydrolase [Linnemannia elongata AG-77]